MLDYKKEEGRISTIPPIHHIPTVCICWAEKCSVHLDSPHSQQQQSIQEPPSRGQEQTLMTRLEVWSYNFLNTSLILCPVFESAYSILKNTQMRKIDESRFK